MAAREQSSGATLVREFDFSHIGLVTRVVRVPAESLASVATTLRAQPGVREVTRTGYRRYLQAVTNPYFTDDPMFVGFGAPGPLYETSSTEGQWDKHVVRLEYAFGYSQSNNGSSVAANPNALGSSSIKIAIIDSGLDTGHPELASKIAYQKCIITNPDNVQSTSNFVTDEDGHGTDVAGIAAADTNNGLGFAGSAGKAVLYGYRVFPTPDNNCSNMNTTDPQCGSDTVDIAAALNDATAQGVNVINMSFGGGAGDVCTNGVDPDSTEGTAVADAVAAGIVLVAAAGNNSVEGVSAPGCDSGVIAAGATGLADGVTNGTGSATGSAAAPNEYLASYSDYGSPGAALNSASAWGIVAPGGDPAEAEATCTAANCVDALHWIDNIWTSTPFDESTDAGDCAPDPGSASGTDDCRTLIVGTSMSSPAVAGAAALILAVNSSYQSPSKMKQLLCSTADDISDPHEGCGRLDLDRAMAVAIGDPSLPAARGTP
jgi:subtilisin family serine protease